jgi:hypothetical protein
MNKIINNNRRKIFSFITCLCLTILLSSNYSFAQEFVTINYKNEKHYVATDMVCLAIKENYSNNELLDKIKKSGYEIVTSKPHYLRLLLRTDGKQHILEHYYKL